MALVEYAPLKAGVNYETGSSPTPPAPAPAATTTGYWAEATANFTKPPSPAVEPTSPVDEPPEEDRDESDSDAAADAVIDDINRALATNDFDNAPELERQIRALKNELRANAITPRQAEMELESHLGELRQRGPAVAAPTTEPAAPAVSLFAQTAASPLTGGVMGPTQGAWPAIYGGTADQPAAPDVPYYAGSGHQPPAEDEPMLSPYSWEGQRLTQEIDRLIDAYGLGDFTKYGVRLNHVRDLIATGDITAREAEARLTRFAGELEDDPAARLRRGEVDPAARAAREAREARQSNLPEYLIAPPSPGEDLEWTIVEDQFPPLPGYPQSAAEWEEQMRRQRIEAIQREREAAQPQYPELPLYYLYSEWYHLDKPEEFARQLEEIYGAIPFVDENGQHLVEMPYRGVFSLEGLFDKAKRYSSERDGADALTGPALGNRSIAGNMAAELVLNIINDQFREEYKTENYTIPYRAPDNLAWPEMGPLSAVQRPLSNLFEILGVYSPYEVFNEVPNLGLYYVNPEVYAAEIEALARLQGASAIHPLRPYMSELLAGIDQPHTLAEFDDIGFRLIHFASQYPKAQPLIDEFLHAWVGIGPNDVTPVFPGMF